MVGQGVHIETVNIYPVQRGSIVDRRVVDALLHFPQQITLHHPAS